AAVGAFSCFGLVVLPCRVFAGLRLVVRRRPTYRSLEPTTVAYHTMGSIVQHSKFGCRLTATGQKHALPRRSIAVCFTPVSGIDSRSQALPSRANCGHPYLRKDQPSARIAPNSSSFIRAK